ncbi:MAG: hypothetical protein C0490_12600 [Marivirga sp.]|nr:hypothetical protein [Marivirga sp.]
MRHCFQKIVIGLIGLSFTSCSWLVNLVVANSSDKEVRIRYSIPLDKLDEQFYKLPKTYAFDKKLLKLYEANETKRPNAIPTDFQIISETGELEIKIKPGQAVHVGFYGSYQPRLEVISRNNLKIISDSESAMTVEEINSKFSHWGNMHTDLLEVK